MTYPTEALAYSVVDAAKLLGTSRSAIYLELKAGRMTGRKSGRRTLIPRAEIDRWLSSLPVMGVAA
jgi:excisionase family DNA binding protein